MPIQSSSLLTSTYTQDDIEAAPEAVRGATIEQAKADLLTPSILRALELSAARNPGTRGGGAYVKRLQPVEAKQYMVVAGLDGQFTFDREYTESALKLMADRKRAELKRQSILARADQSGTAMAGRFGLTLATSFLDPLTVATGFVPVISEAKYAQLLGKAGGAFGRAGVRATVGAAEGAAGSALVEPIIAGAKYQEQADYTMADSLLNVAVGTVLGGGLHTVGGAFGDALKLKTDGLSSELINIPTGENLSVDDRAIETAFRDRLQRDPQAAIDAYAKLPDSEGGKILNTDIARELSPDYLKDRTKSAAVHEPASAIVKQMYVQKLAEAPKAGEEPLVVFSAGGTGAGKTSGLRVSKVAERAQIIYDTNMNSLASSVKRIEQALAANKQVQIVYTYRDPVEALVGGALPRAERQAATYGSGRTVPLNEHAKTHAGSAEVVQQLAEQYANDPRVNIVVVDNSRGPDGAVVSDLSVVRDNAKAYDGLEGKLNEALKAERQAGRISEATYRGFEETLQPEGIRTAAGTGRGQEPQQSAAEIVSQTTPDVREAALRSTVAQAVIGQPIEARPVFDRGTFKEAAAHLSDPDQRPLADPAAVQRVDDVIRAGEAADDAAIERQVQDLDEQLKAMEADAELNGDTDMADIAAALRDELKQADTITRESTSHAKMLVTCATRSAA